MATNVVMNIEREYWDHNLGEDCKDSLRVSVRNNSADHPIVEFNLIAGLKVAEDSACGEFEVAAARQLATWILNNTKGD